MKKFNLFDMIVISIILVVAMAWPFWAHLAGNFQASVSSCEGIEEYYNDSFERDYGVMLKDIYWNCESNFRAEPLNRIFTKTYSPKDIKDCEGKWFDCEDVSHATMCLAELHDVDCRYYTDITIGDVSHRGINCYLEGKWKRVN